MARIDPHLGWTREQLLLLMVANSWRQEPFDPFKEPDSIAMDQDDFAAYLARPRTECTGGE